MAEDLVAHAKDLEAKFQLYVISLIFTLLAASIQTSKLGVSKVQDIAELLAWLSLLSSGLLSLSYAEWSPIIHRHIGTKRAFSDNLRQAIALRKGTPASATVARTLSNSMSDEEMSRDGAFIEKLDAKITSLGAKAQKKYNAAKYLFVAGLVLAVSARSAGAVASLFGFRLQ